MTINRLFGLLNPSDSAPTTTRDGMPAWERTLPEQYAQMLLTNTLTNTFYASADTLLDEAGKLHDSMLAYDPHFMAQALIYARREGFMRSQPIYGLAKLAYSDYASARQTAGSRANLDLVFDRVIRTPKDLSDFLVILKALGHGQGGRRIKRIVDHWLSTKLSPYWAIKYGASRDNGGYSLRDMLITLHPTGLNKALAEYIVRGTLPSGAGMEQIAAFEALKQATSAEEKVGLITAGRLPQEVASGFAGRDKAVWEAIGKNMPIFALLRHLATLERVGATENLALRSHIISMLTNATTIRESGIFPHQFLLAYEKVAALWLRAALSDATDLAIGNLPTLAGRTAIMLDVSGSMEPYIKQAGIFAVALAKASADNTFWTFNTRAKLAQFNPRDSVITSVGLLHAGGGTDTGAVMSALVESRAKYDNLILISDEQQNSGTAFFDMLSRYRLGIAPQSKVFVVNVTPNSAASAPPTDTLTYYLYGWSDSVLRYLALAANGFGSLVEQIGKSDVK